MPKVVERIINHKQSLKGVEKGPRKMAVRIIRLSISLANIADGRVYKESDHIIWNFLSV